MKKLVVFGLVLSCMVFARMRSESWTVQSLNVGNGTVLTAPFQSAGLWVQNNSQISTVNIILQGNQMVTLRPQAGVDLFPLSFAVSQRVTLDVNRTPGVASINVTYIWFNNKE